MKSASSQLLNSADNNDGMFHKWFKSISFSLAFLFMPAMAFAATDGSRSDSQAPVDMAAAGDVLVSHVTSGMVAPVIVTAADLITKVYGAIDIPAKGSTSKKDMIIEAAKTLKVRPEVDETGVWFDSESGYTLCYSGMTPEVSAVAEFDDDALSGFSYFFLFPYIKGEREEANRHQCAFCESLLQEMYDMGSIVGVPADEDSMTPDTLFTALGSYDGNHINVSLHEEYSTDNSGRFLLMLQVTPDAYNLFDSIMAMEK